MGNQPGKQNVYKQYYDALKNGTAVPTIPTSGNAIDPYEVLGVSKQFTWDELKASYRRTASLVHPDKGGSDKLFQMVTDSFRQLAKEYQMRSANTSHHDMKQASTRFYEEHPGAASASARGAGGAGIGRGGYDKDSAESFQERFNRLFDEHRIEEDEQRGYGHIMAQSSKTREDINIAPVLKKFNKDSFNNAFNKLPMREQNQVVKFKEPEAMVVSKNIAFTELGGKTADFTHQDPMVKSGLFYTDYMEAYNEQNQRLIDTEKYQRKEFKTVDQYDAYRKKKSARPISDREQQHIAQQKELEEQREAERLERLKSQDEMYRAQHEKLTRLMLR